MNQFLRNRILPISAAIALAALSANARQPERGYRGFVEWSNRYARHSNSYWKNTYYTGISTSHGFQFNPWLFVGAGIDYEIDHKNIKDLNFNVNKLSFFVHGRTDLKFKSFTPFGDIRIGCNTTSSSYEKWSLYFSPSIGYRINWGRRIGVNISAGYTLDSSRSEEFIIGSTPEGYQILVPSGRFRQWNTSYFSFRIGLDF